MQLTRLQLYYQNCNCSNWNCPNCNCPNCNCPNCNCPNCNCPNCHCLNCNWLLQLYYQNCNCSNWNSKNCNCWNYNCPNLKLPPIKAAGLRNCTRYILLRQPKLTFNSFFSLFLLFPLGFSFILSQASKKRNMTSCFSTKKNIFQRLTKKKKIKQVHMAFNCKLKYFNFSKKRLNSNVFSIPNI